jgi:hypothetical protein
MFAHILPRSETRINVPPCTVTYASSSQVLCFLFCGFLLVNEVNSKNNNEKAKDYQLAVQYKWASLSPSECTFDNVFTGCDNKLTGSNSITFLWETEAGGGAGGRKVGGFSATGFSGVNCLERAAEFVKGDSCVSAKPPRPKQAPERYSDACKARSIWSSLLPRLNSEPSSSASELTLPVVRLKH